MYATFDLDDLARVHKCLAILHFKTLFFDKNYCILDQFLLTFVPKDLIVIKSPRQQGVNDMP